jgi:hypothetical protein
MRVQEQAQDAAIIEQVRRRLEAQEGIPLPQGRAPLGRKTDGTQRQHTFDLVAENRAIIGEVRTYTLGEGGGRPAGKFAHCYAACLYLFRTKARRKVLILTDQAFWSRFRRESDGIVEGIEVIHIPVDDTAPILLREPPSASPVPMPPRPPGRPPLGPPIGRPGRAPVEGARGFTPQDEIPRPRRNKGGPGPRGRHPNTGQRRPGS